MNFVLKPSLESLTLAKISSTLWNQSDVVASLENFNSLGYYSINSKEWGMIEEQVVEKVKWLPLPELLKEKVSSFVRHMAVKVCKWMKFPDRGVIRTFEYVDRRKPAKFVWTQHGTIDRKETVKLLIEDETVDPETRYKMAYIYCMEGDVQKIWDSLPEDFKDPLFKIEKKDNPGVINEQDLVSFWSKIHKLDEYVRVFVADNMSRKSYGDAFISAVQNDNKVAAEYFLHKLTPKELDKCLIIVMQCVTDVEVLCLLFSHMSEEQLNAALQKNHVFLTQVLLDWPWTSLYVEASNCMWDALTNAHIYSSFPLTALTRCKSNYGFQNAMYRKLFIELWECICERFHSHDDVACINRLVSELCQSNDKKGMELIFQDLSPVIKKELILSKDGLSISEELVKKNKWELLEFFIQQCLPSEHESRLYKKKLNRFRPYYFRTCKRKSFFKKMLLS